MHGRYCRLQWRRCTGLPPNCVRQHGGALARFAGRSLLTTTRVALCNPSTTTTIGAVHLVWLSAYDGLCASPVYLSGRGKNLTTSKAFGRLAEERECRSLAEREGQTGARDTARVRDPLRAKRGNQNSIRACDWLERAVRVDCREPPETWLLLQTNV